MPGVVYKANGSMNESQKKPEACMCALEMKFIAQDHQVGLGQ